MATTTPDQFLSSLSSPGQVLQLFEYMTDVQLFIKDAQSRFVQVNAASLAMHGCTQQAEIAGKTDYDFHPPALAAQYVAEDQRVMQSGQSLPQQAWLVLDHQRTPHWYLCTKLPLWGWGRKPRQKVVVGLAGILRPYEHAGESPRDYHRLSPVMEYVLSHYHEYISLQTLAGLAHFSVSQLQREFRRLFNITPGEYLLKVRLLNARRRLEESTAALGHIAEACGFCDQSHFTRAFQSSVGMPPLAYRKRFQKVMPTLSE